MKRNHPPVDGVVVTPTNLDPPGLRALRRSLLRRKIAHLLRFVVAIVVFSFLARWSPFLEFSVVILLFGSVLLGLLVQHILWMQRGILPQGNGQPLVAVEGDTLHVHLGKRAFSLLRSQIRGARYTALEIELEDGSLEGSLSLEVCPGAASDQQEGYRGDAIPFLPTSPLTTRVVVPSSARGFEGLLAWVETMPSFRQVLVRGW